MSVIFDNAIDSLEFGINVWLEGEHEMAPKYTILNIFHAVELLLKEKLYRVHPLLIFSNINKPISDESKTVGLDEILARFKNLGIVLTESEIRVLKDLRKRRNRIVHHSYTSDPGHNQSARKALKFIYYFLPNHLETKLEDELLETSTFEKARKEILEYEEQMEEALKEVESLTIPRTKADLTEMPDCACCPECGNDTVVIGSEKGDFCYFCREEMEMERCSFCNEYASRSELEENDMCFVCEELRFPGPDYDDRI